MHGIFRSLGWIGSWLAQMKQFWRLLLSLVLVGALILLAYLFPGRERWSGPYVSENSELKADGLGGEDLHRAAPKSEKELKDYLPVHPGADKARESVGLPLLRVKPDCLAVSPIHCWVDLVGESVPLECLASQDGSLPVDAHAVERLVVNSKGWKLEDQNAAEIFGSGVVQVHALSKLHGKVYSAETGEGVEGFELWVHLAASGTEVRDRVGALTQVFHLSDSSDFLLGGFIAGNGWVDAVKLHVKAPGYLRFESNWIPLSDLGESMELELPLVVDRGQKIRVQGTVSRSTGESMKAVNCYLVPESSLLTTQLSYQDGILMVSDMIDGYEANAHDNTSCATNENGFYALESDRAGRYYLLVNPKGFPARLLDLGELALEPTPLGRDVSIEDAGTLEVFLSLPPGEKSEDYSVQIPGDLMFRSSGVITASGERRFVFDGLPVGEVTVDLIKRLAGDWSQGYSVIESRALGVVAGSPETEYFEVPDSVQGSECVVRVPEVEGVAREYWIVLAGLQQGGACVGQGVTDAEGVTVLQGLPQEDLFLYAIGFGNRKGALVVIATDVLDSSRLEGGGVVAESLLAVCDTSIDVSFDPDSEYQRDALVYVEGAPEDSRMDPLIAELEASGVYRGPQFHIQGLPPGKYKFSTGDGAEEKLVVRLGRPASVGF